MMMMTMMMVSLGFHILYSCSFFVLRSRQFLPRGNHQETERFFNLGPVLPSLGDTILEDPGNFSVYPCALDRAGSWPEAGSHRCPLRLEITLASPLDEKDSWYLICMFEHAGRAVFNGRKYESSYSSFPWLRR